MAKQRPQPEPSPENPLSFVGTEDLLNELMERFDHVAFAGMLSRKGAQDIVGVIRRYKGHVYMISGLADEVGRLAVDNARRSSRRRGGEGFEL